jgi:hypothetical protein
VNLKFAQVGVAEQQVRGIVRSGKEADHLQGSARLLRRANPNP